MNCLQISNVAWSDNSRGREEIKLATQFLAGIFGSVRETKKEKPRQQNNMAIPDSSSNTNYKRR